MTTPAAIKSLTGQLSNRQGRGRSECGHHSSSRQRDGVAAVRAEEMVGRRCVQLGRESGTARARQLVGVQPWDELRFQGRLENTARLRDGEVAAVAEHVAESRSRDMRIGAPARHFLCVRAKPRAAIGWCGMCRQECGLDARQVVALAEMLEDARRLELALALEVIAGLRLDGGGAALE